MDSAGDPHLQEWSTRFRFETDEMRLELIREVKEQLKPLQEQLDAYQADCQVSKSMAQEKEKKRKMGRTPSTEQLRGPMDARAASFVCWPELTIICRLYTQALAYSCRCFLCIARPICRRVLALEKAGHCGAGGGTPFLRGQAGSKTRSINNRFSSFRCATTSCVYLAFGSHFRNNNKQIPASVSAFCLTPCHILHYVVFFGFSPVLFFFSRDHRFTFHVGG